MRSVGLVISLILSVSVISAQQSPFATRVIEYRPAPGQYINDPAAGTSSAAIATMNEPSTAVSLGGFGGYIIYGFDHRIMNDPANPYGIDFTIFGNALPNHAEQGIIKVMKDENNNGIPDDTWYEISGSDHYSGEIKRNYTLTYYNPGTPSASNVPWKDNSGNTGYMIINNFHLQPYYPDHSIFPGIPSDSLTFRGSLLPGKISKINGTFVSLPSAFGYADNRPVNSTGVYTVPDNPYTLDVIEGSGGDAIDISWARDDSGNYGELDGVDFIMIYSGLNLNSGWLGELSTEIRGIADVAPDPSIQGTESLILPLNLPEKISVSTHLTLRSLFFERGRLIPVKEIEWISSDNTLAQINSDSVLTALKPGKLRLFARIKNTGINLFEKQLTISTPVEFRIENIPGFIRQEQVFTLNFHVIDNTGDRLSGLKPVITLTGEDVLQIISSVDGKLTLKALKPGIADLNFSLPGFPLLTKKQEFIVEEKFNQFEVSVSLLKDSLCVFPRKSYLVNKQEITEYIDRMETGYVVGRKYITVADVLVSVLIQEGFNTAGNKFRFRQDEPGDHKLYLWQFGMNYEFIYGWGGADALDAYAKAWIAVINDNIYVNAWDTIEVHPDDIISFRYVSDIRYPWNLVQVIPGKKISLPGEETVFKVKQLLVTRYFDKTFSVSGPYFLPDAKVLVNEQPVIQNNSTLFSDYSGEFSLQFNNGGKYFVGTDNTFSESAEININYPLGNYDFTGNEVNIFPNPCTDILCIKTNNPDINVISIYSLDGKLIFTDTMQKDKTEHQMNIGSLSQGIYIFELKGEKRNIIRKIIKH